ncbi:hypothetical protein CS022_04570 [Veronia nyctiphanis]|uniref:Uncharacterized protein n=1 Tax=Veronia nyctiphanis TaxID=1278244 RepID=A0A4Q0YYN3_9GAMM|nr:major capsid protein [Veronia nyctiphanis]RXJ74329.1 hypothetical protein CS022_04570 [Veronia nyctiphanis]
MFKSIGKKVIVAGVVLSASLPAFAEGTDVDVTAAAAIIGGGIAGVSLLGAAVLKVQSVIKAWRMARGAVR